ncbi:unnamed protein product [Lampetra fluviatilis]
MGEWVGVGEVRSRLRFLTSLDASSLPLGEGALRALTRHSPALTHLQLQRCHSLTDSSLALLLAVGNATRHQLTHISLAGCEKLTERSLHHLSRCVSLRRVDLSDCRRVSHEAFRRFAAALTTPLTVAGERLAWRAPEPAS